MGDFSFDNLTEEPIPPDKGTLGNWRFFAFRHFGPESPAVAYLEKLCVAFGADHKITMPPGQFLDHIARLNHAAVIEAELRAIYSEFPYGT
jgi:hypothetical protein